VSSFRSPLVASILGHGGVLALLMLFAAQLPPMPLPEPRKAGIEVMLAPPQPVAETPPPAEPPPVAETQPPPPEPPPPAIIPKPEPPPPPPKPVVHKPVVKPPPPPRPAPQPVRELPAQPPQLPLPIPQRAPVQTAMVPVPPAPHPAPVVSAGYRAALSAWLESHKRYPDSARSRGEEGRAVLRFRVDRAGRVLNYAVVSSTGYADLDASIDAMMRGATMPPFPADMAASDVEVSVTVRFALTH
jgi:protein TonB